MRKTVNRQGAVELTKELDVSSEQFVTPRIIDRKFWSVNIDSSLDDHVPQSIIERAKMMRKYRKATSHLEKRANRFANFQPLVEIEKPPPLECMGRAAVLVFIAFILIVHILAEYELPQNEDRQQRMENSTFNML